MTRGAKTRHAVVRLHSGGIPVLLLGLVLTAVGVLAETPIVAFWGECVLALLGLLWLGAVHSAAQLQETLALDVIDVRSPRGTLLAREAAEVELRVVGSSPTSDLVLDPVTTRGVSFPRRTFPGTSLDGPTNGDSNERTVVLPGRALAAGPAFLHGIHVGVAAGGGLFRVHTYLPVGRELRVLPRAASTRHDRFVSGNDLREAVLPSNRRVRGRGSDIRELRDHVPGDPFKHIAWKASARRGRLVVKEFEDEATVSVYILLDVGPALRTGPVGYTRLDGAIEAVMGLARSLSRSHDRLGLVTYDRRVLGFSRADAGPRVLEPLVRHLTETSAVVHEGFTEEAGEEVAARLAAFLEAQDGARLRLPTALGSFGAGGSVDLGRLHDKVQGDLAFLQTASLDRVSSPLGDPASEPVERDLREYCRRRGVELTYRSELPGEDRTQGLLSAIDRCLKDGSTGHVFVVVTDVADLTAAAMAPVLRLTRAHRHQLVLVCPEAPRDSEPDGSLEPKGLEARLRTLLRVARDQTRDRVARELAISGIRTIRHAALSATPIRSP